jgi:CHASE3 domain sensor protein
VATREQVRRRALAKRLKLTAIVLVSSLVALVLATILLVRQDRLVREATAQQASFNGWFGQLQGVLLLLTDAETGQRGYLLTGQPRYLQPYEQAIEQLPLILDSLDAIPTAMPPVSKSVRDIRLQSRLKLTELAATIRLQQEGQHEAALTLVQTDVGRGYMEQLRSDISRSSKPFAPTVATALRESSPGASRPSDWRSSPSPLS